MKLIPVKKMLTVLLLFGWRFFFYPNEGNEPIHIHCQNGEKRGKFWLNIDEFDILEANSYKMNQRDRRIVRKVLFQNFDQIVEAWEKIHGNN